MITFKTLQTKQNQKLKKFKKKLQRIKTLCNFFSFTIVIDLLINNKIYKNMEILIETELQNFCKENDIRVNVNYKNLADAFVTVKKNSKNSKFGDFLYELKQKLDKVPTFILGLELSM